MKEVGHLKLVHFFLSATLGSLIPYLPVLFICNGIGFLKSGILLSLPPFIGLFTRPVIMSLVEKFSFFKPSLILGVTLNSCILLLLEFQYHSNVNCGFNNGFLTTHSSVSSLTTASHQNSEKYCLYQNYKCSYVVIGEESIARDVGEQDVLDHQHVLKCCHDIVDNYRDPTFITDKDCVKNYPHQYDRRRAKSLSADQFYCCNEIFTKSTIEHCLNKTFCNDYGHKSSSSQTNDHIFIGYAVIMTVYSVYSCAILPILDSLTTQFCRNLPDVDFNMQKLWATAGYGSAALLSAILLSMSNYFEVQTFFHGFVPFIPFLVFSIVSIFLITFLKFSKPTPSSQLCFGFSTIVHNTEALFFLLIMTVFGFLAGVHSVFFVLYLLQIDAYYIFIGIAFSMYAFLDLFLYFSRRKILYLLGSRAIISFAFWSYFVRYSIYSYASNAWVVLPLEVLHGICFSTMRYASMDLAAQIAPMGLGSSFQALISKAYWHVGVGIGAVFGGVLYEHSGYVVMWRTAAIISLVTGVMYAVFTHVLHPFLVGRGCLSTSVAADTQDFFEDDLDDLLDNDVAQLNNQGNFTSDEEYLILDAPGDYSIVDSKGERFITPERDRSGEAIAAANRSSFVRHPNIHTSHSNGNNVLPTPIVHLAAANDDKFTIEDINV